MPDKLPTRVPPPEVPPRTYKLRLWHPPVIGALTLAGPVVLVVGVILAAADMPLAAKATYLGGLAFTPAVIGAVLGWGVSGFLGRRRRRDEQARIERNEEHRAEREAWARLTPEEQHQVRVRDSQRAAHEAARPLTATDFHEGIGRIEQKIEERLWW